MAEKEKRIPTPISPDEGQSLKKGDITISDEVVAFIAAQAARKVEGVIVVGSSFRLSEILGAKEPSYKGVTVKTDQATGHVEIEVDVNVVYGVNIYEAASELQRQIINDIEALTGSMIADKVHVSVKKVIMPEESPPPDSAPVPVRSKPVAPRGGRASASTAARTADP